MFDTAAYYFRKIRKYGACTSILKLVTEEDGCLHSARLVEKLRWLRKQTGLPALKGGNRVARTLLSKENIWQSVVSYFSEEI